jgi:hypothetical protein
MYATNTPYARDPATTPTIPPVPLPTNTQHAEREDGQQARTQHAALSTQHAQLGSSNTAAICFAAAQAIAHDVEKVSYAFLTSTVVPYGEMVNALKVMTGTHRSEHGGTAELHPTNAYYAASLTARCMQ